MLQSTLKWLQASQPNLLARSPPPPYHILILPTYPHVQKSFTHLGVKLEMRNGTLDRSRQEQAAAASTSPEVSTINGSHNNRDGVLSNIVDYTLR